MQRFEDCLTCEGLGEWDEGPINCGSPVPYVISPEYRQVICPDCNGAGKVTAQPGPWRPYDEARVGMDRD